MARYSIPTTHEPLYQERGTRFSRKLPYELHVDTVVDDEETVRLLFRNTGSKGVVFHVYDKLHLDRIPRRYTVEAGKTLADEWSIAPDQGRYDLWVYAPNGFVRAITDLTASPKVGARPECQLEYDNVQGDVTIAFHNTGAESCKFLIEDSAYRSGGPWVIEVTPGQSVQKLRSLKDSAHWYDLSVSCDKRSGFLRRFAGRVETGKHSLSDPMMGAD
ncbi:MAG: phospholipase domain-containing protein [Pseudomonadota bacterium]